MQITTSKNQIHVGVLGFGGLGQAAARILTPKQEMAWVAAADQKGYVYNRQGLNPDHCICLLYTSPSPRD